MEVGLRQTIAERLTIKGIRYKIMSIDGYSINFLSPSRHRKFVALQASQSFLKATSEGVPK